MSKKRVAARRPMATDFAFPSQANTLNRAAPFLAARNIGCISVDVDGQLEGPVTDRDICVASYSTRGSLHDLRVSLGANGGTGNSGEEVAECPSSGRSRSRSAAARMKKVETTIATASCLVFLSLSQPVMADSQPVMAENAEAKPAPARDHESLGYWGDQPARWHIATELAVGAPSLVQVAAGYGKPHFAWVAMTANAAASTEFASAAVGPQLNLLLLNVAVKLRHTSAFNHRFPALSERYDSDDLTDEMQPRASYTTLDTWFWGVVPAGPTLGMWGVYGTRVLDFPEQQGVYSELFRYTMNENQAWLTQLVWWWRFSNDSVLVGPAADAVFSPERSPIYRAGGSVFVRFGDHLSAELSATLPVRSPDDVDWITQAWGITRLRWQWASAEPSPGWW